MGLMGWFSRLMRREQKGMTSADIAAAFLLGGGSSKSGVAVTVDAAFQATTALACVRVIANGLAQVPIKVMRSDGQRRAPATEHPLYGLLAVGPNEFQTSYEFREMLGLHLAMCGNAYVWLNRVNGKIVEMLPYSPRCVNVKRAEWGVEAYEVTTSKGRSISLPPSDVWHLKRQSWDGVVGMEGVRLAREAIGLALATEEHGARLFKNGARVGGLLSTEASLGPEARMALKKSWEAAHVGNDNAFKTAVLWGGMKWTALSSPNDQAQFLETRRFQVEEVCRAFGVLPIMVGHSDKAATYASAEQMFLQHVVHTLSPWYACIENSANMRLLSDEDRENGLYVKFNANGLMRGAAKDRADFYSKLYAIGALCPNDIRELEDMNPYEGGDEFRVPLNMIEPGKEPVGEEEGNGKA